MQPPPPSKIRGRVTWEVIGEGGWRGAGRGEGERLEWCLPVYFVVDQRFDRLIEAGLRVDVNKLLRIAEDIWK